MRSRYMVKSDLPEVLAIESASFANPWDEDDLLRMRARRTVWAQVVEHSQRILGYSVFELPAVEVLGAEQAIELLRLAVHPAARRLGVGSELIERLRRRLSERRPILRVFLDERSLEAQLFCRDRGFRATKVLRRFQDNGDDLYVMELRQPAASLQPQRQPV